MVHILTVATQLLRYWTLYLFCYVVKNLSSIFPTKNTFPLKHIWSKDREKTITKHAILETQLNHLQRTGPDGHITFPVVARIGISYRFIELHRKTLVRLDFLTSL